VLLGLPREWLRSRREAALREVVRDLRDHPAILAWYKDEIAQGGDVEAVLLEARVVAEEDPEHGLVIEESSRDERLRSIARARMFTYYPVTSAARAAGRWQTLPERFPVRDLAVPFWPVLQAFGRELVSGSPHHDLLVPTPDELRFSLHSAIAAGAAGIFFYPYMHATRYDRARAAAGSWAYSDYRPLPEVAPGLWRAVLDCRSLAARLLDLRRGAAPASLSVRPPADVEVRGWTTPQGLLVVAANAGAQTRSVRIRVEPQAGLVQPLSGPGTDPGWRFSGHEVRLKVPGPGGMAVLVSPAP
jgi:hypothetical protein